MFPPIAHSTPEVAAAISEQLQRCGRLLPAHDDGGGFFLALLRRRAGAARPPPKRGGRARLAGGREVTVRGPGTGRFRGLVRVAFADGSQRHVLREELEVIDVQDSTPSAAPAAPGPAAGPASGGATAAALLAAAPAEERAELTAFLGLIDGEEAAAATGVEAFPGAALVRGPGGSLALASAHLRGLAAPGPGVVCAAVGRPVFFRASPASEAAGAEEEGAVPWRPVAEAATLLARCCSRRVVCASAAALSHLLGAREVDASDVGIEPSWVPGPVIIALAKEVRNALPMDIAVAGQLLCGGRLRLRARACVVRHLTAVLRASSEAGAEP